MRQRVSLPGSRQRSDSTPSKSLSSIRRQLRTAASSSRAAAVQRYFKTGPGEYGEGDRFLGVTVPAVRTVAMSCRDLPLSAIAGLLRSPWHEERLLALIVLVLQYVEGTPARREKIYRLYMRRIAYVNNWDLVDTSDGDRGRASVRTPEDGIAPPRTLPIDLAAPRRHRRNISLHQARRVPGNVANRGFALGRSTRYAV